VDPEQRDQRATDERADRGRDADGGTEVAERLAALLAPEQALDEARDLRGDQAAGKPLQDAQQHQRDGGRRQPARRAGHHEQGHADHEHRASAVRVAEAARRNEQQAERERIARDDPLELVRLCVQAPLDARQRDVDDRDIKQRHEAGREADAERHPTVRIGAVPVAARRRRRSGGCGGHGPWLVDTRIDGLALRRVARAFRWHRSMALHRLRRRAS
jgi:hypothetical protein